MGVGAEDLAKISFTLVLLYQNIVELHHLRNLVSDLDSIQWYRWLDYICHSLEFLIPSVAPSPLELAEMS